MNLYQEPIPTILFIIMPILLYIAYKLSEVDVEKTKTKKKASKKR